MADAESKNSKFKVIETVKISYTPSHPNAISWSPDGRLSVISDRCVYVLTPISSPSHPSLNLERTSIPASKKPFQVDVGIDRRQISAEKSPGWQLDPRVNNYIVQTPVFQKVAWSPLNCDESSRCVIATLFSDFQLRIYVCPSASAGVKWREACDLSYLLSSYLKSHNFEISEDIMQGDITASKQPGRIGQKLQRTKYSRFVQRVQMLTFTSLHWFSEVYHPAIDSSITKVVNGSFKNKQFALLTTGTQSGHVIFWMVTTPVKISNPNSVQLQGFLNVNQSWSTSLAWQQVTENQGILAVGCLDGFIKAFSIKLFPSLSGVAEYVLWGDKDEMQVHNLQWMPLKQEKDNHCLVACKGSSVILFSMTSRNGFIVTKPTQKIVTQVHRMPITGLHCLQDGTVFTCSLDGSVQMLTDDANISKSVDYDDSKGFSCHGIGVSANGVFITLFLSRTDYTRKFVEWHEAKVLFVNTACGLPSVTQLLSKDCLQMEKKWDVCKAIQYFIHRSKAAKEEFHQLVFMEDLERLSHPQLILRQHVLTLIVLTSKNDTQEVNKILGIDISDQLECTINYLYKHLATAFLRNWINAPEQAPGSNSDSVAVLVTCDWLVTKFCDSASLDLANEVYQVFNDVDGLKLLSSFKEKVDVHMSSSDEAQMKIQESSREITQNGKEQITEQLVDSNATPQQDVVVLKNACNNIPALPMREKCKICKSGIPLESATHGTCLNGHKWPRCCVSFVVCTDLKHKCCQDCSCCVSNPQSGSSTWLRNLLEATLKCPFCFGFFRA